MGSIKKAAGKIVQSPAGKAVAGAETAVAVGIAKVTGKGDRVPAVKEAGKKLTGGKDSTDSK